MDAFDSPQLLKALESLERGDYQSALAILIPLAEAGNPKAQCNLALLYSAGLGVSRNGAKAVDLYLKVAEQNVLEGHLSALAYNNLATLYFTGLADIQLNREKAQEYLSRARKLGLGM